MRKTLAYLLFPVPWFTMLAQNVDNSYYVRQFPGATIGQKTTAAQAACNPDASIPCIIVFDPSLVKWAPGAMPSPCAQCQWLDYRSGAPYIPSGGGTATGLLQLNSVNNPFSLSTTGPGKLPINLAPGLYIYPTWNGTTAGPLANNVNFYGLYLNGVNSRPGVNRGGLSVNANFNWTTNQLLALSYKNYSQGLSNSFLSMTHTGAGDTLPLYVYGYSGGNATQPDDEGTGAISASTNELKGYTGTVTVGGTGATSIKTNASTNSGNQGDGTPLLDLTATKTGCYITAHANASGNTPPLLTVAGCTFTPSTAIGTLTANLATPGGDPVGTGLVSQTFNVNLTTGAFVANKVACFSGQMHDQGYVTAVGTPSGGIQSVTVSMRQPHQSGSMVFQGGDSCQFIVEPAQNGDGEEYAIDLFGVTDATHIYAAAFNGTTGFYDASTLGGINLGTKAIGSLSNSGTTVSFNFTQGGQVNYIAPFVSAPVVTISGASDSAFNTQCTSLTVNTATWAATCTIAGLSGTHTAASGSVALGDTPSGNGDFSVYAGGEVLDVQGAGNAVDGSFTVEPNNAAWGVGDSVLDAHYPRGIWFGAKSVVTTHDANTYQEDGAIVTVSGAGAVDAAGTQSGILRLGNSEAASNYQYFGGTRVPLPGISVTGIIKDGYRTQYAPSYGGDAIYFSWPYNGESDTGYWYRAWTFGCAADAFNLAGGCGLKFYPGTNTFVDNNTSTIYEFYNLKAYTGTQWQTVGTSLGPVYDTGGNQKTVAHAVIGQCTMTAGTCTVTLSGAAVFTSSTTYQCAPSDATTAAAVKWSPISATQFSLAGTATDVVSFICTGN